ncbi:MAG: hypothetical protein ACRDVD_01645 [Acidimicrobiia bacterium]
MDRPTRILLGLAALGALVAGGAVLLWGSDDTTGGVLIRVGLLLGAGWLVAPLIRRPTLATLGLMVAGALVLVRPRLIVAVVVAAVLWSMSARKRRRQP